jgi:hypothetical protein
MSKQKLEETVAEIATVEAIATVEEAKRPRKVKKTVEKDCVKIEVLGGFPLSELPAAVLEQLPAFGLGHKLGDSAAGCTGSEAEESIQATWDAMIKGEWSVRQPSQPKVTISSIKAGLENLSPEERAAAEATLKALGISL